MHLTSLLQISKIYDPFNFLDFMYHSYNTGQKHYPLLLLLYIYTGGNAICIIVFWYYGYNILVWKINGTV